MPGLLLALVQSHLVEAGVADVFGPLLTRCAPPPRVSPPHQKRIAVHVFGITGVEDDPGGGDGEDDEAVEEGEDGIRQVNVDGELMIVIEK